MPPLSRSSGSRLPERGLGKEGGAGEQRGLRRFGAPCIFSIWRTPLVTESMVHWAMKEPICSPPRDRPLDLASRRTAGKNKEGKQIKSISTSRFFSLFYSNKVLFKTGNDGLPTWFCGVERCHMWTHGGGGQKASSHTLICEELRGGLLSLENKKISQAWTLYRNLSRLIITHRIHLINMTLTCSKCYMQWLVMQDLCTHNIGFFLLMFEILKLF